MFLRWLLCALCCAGAIESYRILVVFPFPGRSHGILGHGVVRHLLNAGHEVTFINHVAIQKPHPKLRQIDISEESEKPVANLKTIMDKEEDLFDLNKFFNMTVGLFRAALRNQQVQELLHDTAQTFDIVIAEWLFTDLYSGLATVFDCPFIWVSTVEPHSTILRLIDESLNPAYNAELIATVAPPYTFVERAKGLLMSVVGTLTKDFYFGRAEAKEFETLLGPIIKKRGRPVPDYADVKYNTSLVLGNSHVSVGEATRLPQNYKAVGGYHIESDIKPLPEDLKKLLDNAKHGVIYFSMGSNLKSKDFPQQLKQELLQMFGTLKQTVLWKFEEDLPNRPGNVHILKWAPQPAILSHPKCILFITHGGLLSSSETIYFGKATIGIPVFADQFLNVERAVKKGYGRRVDLSYHMAGDLKVAIEDVLANPSYANKAKELSFVFHHRPVPPGAELVHWVEHVIRTGGAPHLRSPALRVPLYQKMYLDLAAVVLIAGVVLCKLVKCVCCGKGTKTKVKKN